MLNIAIITGSTRPGRNNEAVADWVYGIANERKDAEFDLVDIASYNLPLLDEPMPPVRGRYAHEHTTFLPRKAILGSGLSICASTRFCDG